MINEIEREIEIGRGDHARTKVITNFEFVSSSSSGADETVQFSNYCVETDREGNLVEETEEMINVGVKVIA